MRGQDMQIQSSVSADTSVFTVPIIPVQKSPGGTPFDLIVNHHDTLMSCVLQNEMARVADSPFLDTSKKG